MELIAISGSIARDAEPWYHIHAALGKRDKSTVGGHLFGGTVWGTLEIFMLASNMKLSRIKKGNLKVLEIL
jgi:predicted DNA-binding protein with PD1-like motif